MGWTAGSGRGPLMAVTTPRLPMHRIREILRQKWGLGRAHREIARSVGRSVGPVWKAVDRASASGLDLAAIDELDDVEVERRLQAVRVEAPALTANIVADCMVRSVAALQLRHSLLSFTTSGRSRLRVLPSQRSGRRILPAA